MRALRRRLERLARSLPAPARFGLTEDERKAWCIKLGVAADSLLLGSPERGFVILPAETDE